MEEEINSRLYERRQATTGKPIRPRPGKRWQKSDLKNNFLDIREVHFLRFECQSFTENDTENFIFLGYRTAYAIGILAIFYLSTRCTAGEHSLHFIYFGSWSVLLQTIYGVFFFIVSLCNTLHHCCYRDEQPDEILDAEFSFVLESRLLGKYEKIVWFLHNISIVFSFLSLLYYLIYPDATRYIGPLSKCGQGTALVVFVTTGLMSFIDILICAIPIRLGHAIYAMMTSLFYSGFALTYELLDGHYNCKLGQDCQYIYPFFNWSRKPGHSALAFLTFSLLPGAIHVLIFFLFKLRLLLCVFTCKIDAYLDHQYPFYISSAQVETTQTGYNVTDPDNPFPRRILINEGLPISRKKALEEVEKIRTLPPVSAQKINYEEPMESITPFPKDYIGDYNAF